MKIGDLIYSREMFKSENDVPFYLGMVTDILFNEDGETLIVVTWGIFREYTWKVTTTSEVAGYYKRWYDNMHATIMR